MAAIKFHPHFADEYTEAQKDEVAEGVLELGATERKEAQNLTFHQACDNARLLSPWSSKPDAPCWRQVHPNPQVLGPMRAEKSTAQGPSSASVRDVMGEAHAPKE